MGHILSKITYKDSMFSFLFNFLCSEYNVVPLVGGQFINFAFVDRVLSTIFGHFRGRWFCCVDKLSEVFVHVERLLSTNFSHFRG